MSKVEISVITATIDRRELMLRKLASLQEQTLPADRFEWIVCDNGGGDGTIEELERRDLPFALRTVELVSNRGPGAGRNACAALAAGEILYLSDDDCLLAPDTLERHLTAQQQRQGVVVGAIRFRPDDGRGHLWRPKRIGYWNVNGANTSLPAGAFRGVGGFDESLVGYGGEDVLLGYRLSQMGLHFQALPRATVQHIGPDPAGGGNLAKAASAGRNAGHIARRYPELRFRLGVHPLLIGVKRVALPVLAPLLGVRAKAELAYALGAHEVGRSRALVSPVSERRKP
ncbi:MAG: glycosyltransferase [Trueperaceae bacterium]